MGEQGNLIKSAGLYSVQNFTTEYTESIEFEDHYKVNHLQICYQRRKESALISHI